MWRVAPSTSARISDTVGWQSSVAQHIPKGGLFMHSVPKGSQKSWGDVTLWREESAKIRFCHSAWRRSSSSPARLNSRPLKTLGLVRTGPLCSAVSGQCLFWLSRLALEPLRFQSTRWLAPWLVRSRPVPASCQFPASLSGEEDVLPFWVCTDKREWRCLWVWLNIPEKFVEFLLEVGCADAINGLRVLSVQFCASRTAEKATVLVCQHKYRLLYPRHPPLPPTPHPAPWAGWA